MKHFLKIEKIGLVLMLCVLITCNDNNYLKSNKEDQFRMEKDKVDKILNEQKLTNYLRKLMMQNNDLLDKSIIFLDHEDFGKIDQDELNYHTMQSNKEDDFEFKARMFAYKWGLSNNKSSMKLVPYSVKQDSDSPHNWKSYLVLLMNSQTNILKKVCFPSEIHENFAIVTKFDKSCLKKIEKFYKYKIFEDEESNTQTSNYSIHTPTEDSIQHDQKVLEKNSMLLANEEIKKVKNLNLKDSQRINKPDDDGVSNKGKNDFKDPKQKSIVKASIKSSKKLKNKNRN